MNTQLLDIMCEMDEQVAKERNWTPPTPKGWHLVESSTTGAAYRQIGGGLIVMVSIGLYGDGKVWQHASLSRLKVMPTYSDLTLVKKDFIGQDKQAVMVLPEKSEHINHHPFCLHLFTCLDRSPLPDFTRGVGTI